MGSQTLIQPESGFGSLLTLFPIWYLLIAVTGNNLRPKNHCKVGKGDVHQGYSGDAVDPYSDGGPGDNAQENLCRRIVVTEYRGKCATHGRIGVWVHGRKISLSLRKLRVLCDYPESIIRRGFFNSVGFNRDEGDEKG